MQKKILFFESATLVYPLKRMIIVQIFIDSGQANLKWM